MHARLRDRRRLLVRASALVAGAVVAASVVSATTGASSRGRSAPDLAAVRAALASAGVPAGVRAAVTTPAAITLPAAETPTCPDPFLDPASPTRLPLPAATFPNGTTTGFGVPFVAALTAGSLLSGFDQDTTLFPSHWRLLIGPRDPSLAPTGTAGQGIDGWVAGVLQVPSLSAQISAGDVVFCNHPQTADQVNFTLQLTASFSDTNYTPNGAFLNAQFALVPGAASLAVTGVDPVKGLELGGSASAETTVTLQQPGIPLEVCAETQYATIPVSSEVPAEPPTGPTAGGQLISGLDARFAPSPLKGAFPGAVQVNPALPPATATLAADSFLVPFFSGARCGSLPNFFDVPLEGWDTNNCPLDTLYGGGSGANGRPCKQTTTEPPQQLGWSQFGITTTIAYIGLPVTTPSGYGF